MCGQIIKHIAITVALSFILYAAKAQYSFCSSPYGYYDLYDYQYDADSIVINVYPQNHTCISEVEIYMDMSLNSPGVTGDIYVSLFQLHKNIKVLSMTMDTGGTSAVNAFYTAKSEVKGLTNSITQESLDVFSLHEIVAEDNDFRNVLNTIQNDLKNYSLRFCRKAELNKVKLTIRLETPIKYTLGDTLATLIYPSDFRIFARQNPTIINYFPSANFAAPLDTNFRNITSHYSKRFSYSNERWYYNDSYFNVRYTSNSSNVESVLFTDTSGSYVSTWISPSAAVNTTKKAKFLLLIDHNDLNAHTYPYDNRVAFQLANYLQPGDSFNVAIVNGNFTAFYTTDWVDAGDENLADVLQSMKKFTHSGGKFLEQGLYDAALFMESHADAALVFNSDFLEYKTYYKIDTLQLDQILSVPGSTARYPVYCLSEIGALHLERSVFEKKGGYIYFESSTSVADLYQHLTTRTVNTVTFSNQSGQPFNAEHYSVPFSAKSKFESHEIWVYSNLQGPWTTFTLNLTSDYGDSYTLPIQLDTAQLASGQRNIKSDYYFGYIHDLMAQGAADSTIARLSNEGQILVESCFLHIKDSTPDPLTQILIYSTEEIETPTSSVKIYPNPASTVVNFEFEDLGQKHTINVYSIAGTLVKTTVISGSENLDVSALMPGIYFIKIEGFAYVAKLVVSR